MDISSQKCCTGSDTARGFSGSTAPECSSPPYRHQQPVFLSKCPWAKYYSGNGIPKNKWKLQSNSLLCQSVLQSFFFLIPEETRWERKLWIRGTREALTWNMCCSSPQLWHTDTPQSQSYCLDTLFCGKTWLGINKKQLFKQVLLLSLVVVGVVLCIAQFIQEMPFVVSYNKTLKNINSMFKTRNCIH